MRIYLQPLSTVSRQCVILFTKPFRRLEVIRPKPQVKGQIPVKCNFGLFLFVLITSLWAGNVSAGTAKAGWEGQMFRNQGITCCAAG